MFNGNLNTHGFSAYAIGNDKTYVFVCCCYVEKRSCNRDPSQTTEMTTTTYAEESLAPTVNTTAAVTDCSDPDQACYYAQLLRVVNILDLYLLPLISIIGCIGNVLSFVVFTTTYLRRLSSSVYLAAPAVSTWRRLQCLPAAPVQQRLPGGACSVYLRRLSSSVYLAAPAVSTCGACPAVSTWPRSLSPTPSSCWFCSAAH